MMRFIFFVIVGLFIVGAIVGNEDEAEAERGASTSGVGTACSADWTKCSGAKTFINEYEGVNALQASCVSEAQKSARYQVKWEGMFGKTLAYGSFYENETLDDGEFTFVDSRALWQNGFGAWRNAQSYCTVNVRTGRIVSFEVDE